MGLAGRNNRKCTVVLRSVALLGQCQFSVQVMSSWVGTWEGAGPGKELGGDLGRSWVGTWEGGYGRPNLFFFLLC